MSYVTAQLRERNRRQAELIKDLRFEAHTAKHQTQHRFTLLQDMAAVVPDEPIDVMTKIIEMRPGERLQYSFACDLRNFDHWEIATGMARAFTELLGAALERRQLAYKVSVRDKNSTGLVLELHTVRLAP